MSAKVTIVGRLGADPEMRSLPNGDALASLRVGSSGRRQVDGKWVDVDTTWWRVTAFRMLAEGTIDKLTKGDKVIIVGTIKELSWDKDGVKQTRLEVVADSVGKDVTNTGVHRVQAADVGPDKWATDPF